MAERSDDDDDGGDDGWDDDADRAPPSSIARRFRDGDPPSPAEVCDFAARFPVVFKAYYLLVWYVLRGADIPPASLENLHQDVFLRYFILGKTRRSAADVADTLAAIARRVVLAYRTKRARRAQISAVAAPPPAEVRIHAEPSASYYVLLREVFEKLSSQDADLLLWAGVEGCSSGEIAARLGVPEPTARTRLRAARMRLADLLGLARKKDPKT